MTAISYTKVMEEARGETRTLVNVERHGGYAVLTLADPGKLNVLSAAMTLQLRQALAGLVADPQIRAVVLTGTDPGFCAGGDLRLMRQVTQGLADPADEDGATTPWRFIRREFGGIVRLIAGGDTAVVAAVNGPAAGVGLALAFACDLIIASERAVLVPAFGRLGLLPEVGTSWFITRRLGYQRAFEYYVSGEHIPARRALELGVVNEVVPHEELLERARLWCERMIALPEHALSMTKPLLRQAADTSWEQALTMEEYAEPSCFTTKPFARSVEGMLRR
ncbi:MULTISPECIES: enoyl-CoA hydratase/isomerase family protein [Thermomonospora]|uniref:Enoyl-CoA hydratase/isomerase n=1 Tax=Thermomonospora curvata (strain ATCC 19995 / DSM 43183 / JCM 3096 / KCTC 9072 / NBRC 15933 / NCIMB 10081 / Henssen B9) TaxID=471852 RepID=D1A1L2_THECD|nr:MULTISPECIES: enoyl-CoA hydratase-related protein [Thermomonospora]ACY95934.1 Enoyl-CoA hydratase/isomerase [Thermomonospora curvata DSM 43183]PKK16178.1 MAG: enoyl-CoA hydratase [Thermomonospora sp. CIF 1]